MAGSSGSGPEGLGADERGRPTTGRTTPGTAAAHGGSLRRRVLVWLLPPLAVLLLVNAFFTYRSALDAVNQAYDRTLTASVRAIGERTHSLAGQIQVDIPYAAFEGFEADAAERIFHAVFDPAGGLVTGYVDLRPPELPADDGSVRIFDLRYAGETVRLAAMRKRLYDPALRGGDAVLIVFAETTGARRALARAGRWRAICSSPACSASRCWWRWGRSWCWPRSAPHSARCCACATTCAHATRRISPRYAWNACRARSHR